ncbi:epoxide hydrolase [Mucilaginibacter sp. BJC16-A38]|uniref:epoxide hydrolase family protein n=1 Tax=Mucilaginibacter phenanthrenivorans TaxID=1234842 RepID=UPI002157BC88|nr:epoxide hydrolase family protein [Mucilaginibacter phenanthrenivorans]MCR8557317.1 epoxide hydrolase [Mucilaginibacter phenanthrenivorans]
MNSKVKPFKIDVSDEVLKDLNNRLLATRWSNDLNNEDSFYGIKTEYLKDLVNHWTHIYDWKEQEKKLNAYDQFKVTIDEQPIHFLHVKGKNKNSIPIILSHGWPWTYWHWSRIIQALTDPESLGLKSEITFDVVIPSLVGFGFSTPVKDGTMNFWKIADLWQKLMTEELGYKKYAAAGCDYGALVTNQLGHKYAESLIGIHLGKEMSLRIFQSERPWDLTEGHLVPESASPELREGILNFQRTYASHVAVHMLDAQTITHGLNDSPAGMLAWVLQRWMKWSDQSIKFEEVFSKDEVITFAMIFWLNQAIGSSIRSYANAARYPWKPSHQRQPLIEAPAGFTFLNGDAFPPNATVENRIKIFENGTSSKQFNTVYAKSYPTGGHFGPWENPAAFIEGITETFSLLANKVSDFHR